MEARSAASGCIDEITHFAIVTPLRAVGRELMRNHLRHCATSAIRGDAEQAEEMYDELIELMYKHVR